MFAMSINATISNQTISNPTTSSRIVILGYHEVEPGGVPSHETIPRQLAAADTADERQRFTISPETFREQMDALAAHGYVVIALADLSDYLQGKRTLPDKSAVITVDDGWQSLCSVIQPELLRRRYPFTAFIYPRVIDRHSHHPNNITWDDVSGLAEAGVDIESHTYAHPFLSRIRHSEMNDAEYASFLNSEIAESKRLISEHTGRDVRFLAYPYGDYDDSVVSSVKAAGYDAAVTVTPGIVTKSSDPLTLPRFLILHDTSMKEFESWLEPEK